MQLKRINNIEVVEQIGSGGMASVFKGVDLNTGQLVAVKILWSNLFKNENMKQCFVSEANHYLYLQHPGIVRLKDFIIKEDAYYLVMEFVDGINLEEYINKVSGPIPEDKAIELMKEVVSAIIYAHEKNVLHLDLKPANIMIDLNGKVKILDFGISHEGASVAKGNVMGSPLYMSPEQTEGKDIDNRSDIYSLGITFFQMLTGKTPLKGNSSREELFQKIREGKLPKAKEFYPYVSDALQLLIDKATQINKSNRFKNANEFLDQLNELKIG